MTPHLSLEYRSALADAVGDEHGLNPADLDLIAPRVAEIVAQIERERAAGKRRYRDLPFDEAMLRDVVAAVTRRRGGCANLVVLGIGGSALGNIALQTALNPATYNLLPADRRGGPRLFVMDNVDPVQFAASLDFIEPELDRTCFNVISKSGETAETAAQFLIARDLLQHRLGRDRAREAILVTTDPKSGTMREIVNAEGYESLPVPDGVGGRFSVLSAVGLFSAGMCGIDLAAVLGGARAMSESIARPALRDNPAALIAAIHYMFYQRGKRLHVMMPYAAALKDLADWYRQLWAESLGKRRGLDGREVFVGPTPIKALGATDQHSQVQLYREGPNDKVFTFLVVDRFERDVLIPPAAAADVPEVMRYLCGASLGRLLNAEQAATEYALTASQRPCLSIRFEAVTPEAVGAFFLLYEAATSIAGLLFGINAYDQPAVQAGKDGTFALMGRTGYEGLAAQIHAKKVPT